MNDFAQRPVTLPHVTPCTDVSLWECLRGCFDARLVDALSIGLLEVAVKEASNLPNSSWANDLRVELELTGAYGSAESSMREVAHGYRIKATTISVPTSQNPVWRTVFERFVVRRQGCVLKCSVIGSSMSGGARLAGITTIPLNFLPNNCLHEDVWFPLESYSGSNHPRGSEELDFYAGPALKLSIRFTSNNSFELLSWLWPHPEGSLMPLKKVHFDPNDLYKSAMSFKTKVLDRVAMATNSSMDAIFWKREIAYSLIAFALCISVAFLISYFWIILHVACAGAVTAVGVSSRGGSEATALQTKPTRSRDEHQASDEHEDRTFSVQRPTETHVFSSTMSSVIRTGAHHANQGEALGGLQCFLADSLLQIEQLESALTWRHNDFGFGHGEFDGPLLAVAFICANVFMALAHVLLPLRITATLAVLAIFLINVLVPPIIHLRKGLRAQSLRAAFSNRLPNQLPTRPNPNNTIKYNFGVQAILHGVFKRLDKNNDGAIDKHEFHAELTRLGMADEVTHDTFGAVDADNDGRLSAHEFSSYVINAHQRKSFHDASLPFMETELRTRLRSHDGIEVARIMDSNHWIRRVFGKARARDQEQKSCLMLADVSKVVALLYSVTDGKHKRWLRIRKENILRIDSDPISDIFSVVILKPRSTTPFAVPFVAEHIRDHLVKVLRSELGLAGEE